MDHWLERGSKQYSATKVRTGVTDDVSRSQKVLRRRPASASSRTAESSKNWSTNDSYLYPGFTYTGEETAPDALCVLGNKALRDISMLPAKLDIHRDTSHPYYKDKYSSSYNISLRH